MTHQDLMNLVATEQSDCAMCCKEDYRAWSPKTMSFNDYFHALGQLDDERHTDGGRSAPFPGNNYWDPEYPINLNYYPQTECEVFQCRICGGILLTYVETSVHSPQERMRWVQKTLVSDATS